MHHVLKNILYRTLKEYFYYNTELLRIKINAYTIPINASTRQFHNCTRLMQFNEDTSDGMALAYSCGPLESLTQEECWRLAIQRGETSHCICRYYIC